MRVLWSWGWVWCSAGWMHFRETWGHQGCDEWHPLHTHHAQHCAKHLRWPWSPWETPPVGAVTIPHLQIRNHDLGLEVHFPGLNSWEVAGSTFECPPSVVRNHWVTLPSLWVESHTTFKLERSSQLGPFVFQATVTQVTARENQQKRLFIGHQIIIFTQHFDRLNTNQRIRHIWIKFPLKYTIGFEN